MLHIDGFSLLVGLVASHSGGLLTPTRGMARFPPNRLRLLVLLLLLLLLLPLLLRSTMLSLSPRHRQLKLGLHDPHNPSLATCQCRR